MFTAAWFYNILWILILAAVLRQPAMAAIAVLLLLAAGLAWLWNHFSLARVTYEREFSELRVFPGEHVTLTLRLANRKALPLAWLEVQDGFPSRLPMVKGRVSPTANPLVAALGHSVAMRWYERIGWRYEFVAAARGYYPFGPFTVRSGDAFGFFESKQDHQKIDHLIVYPRIVDLETLGLPLKQPFGEMRSREKLFEDLSRSIGIRDWQQGDERRRIHWKATARRQSMQVRIFEPSASLNVAIFLNVATLPETWEGSDPELLERAITVAASLANLALQTRCPTGLFVNTSLPGSDRSIRIPPGRNPEQLTVMLEALAKVTAFPIAPLEDILSMETRSLPWGSTIVVVSPILPDTLLTELMRLRAAGHRLTLVALDGELPSDALPGVTIYQPTERR
jgi:uncharacterized protein (DUF58 family)